MDTHAKDLLNDALATAQKLGVPVTLERVLEGEADAVIQIGKGRHAKKYLAEIKRGLRPATLGVALHQINRCDKPALLIAVYVTPPIAKAMMSKSLLGQPLEPSDPASSLTTRQREVLQLVAEGRTIKEIAAILNVSPKTVEFHKYRLMEQLDLRTTAELTQYAVKHGIVSPA